ncbi:hypothetical protein PENSPDRAFT_735460 [Peniophora sp. CONT]|nr:hypothetical protein PENSPDRAFT_735460 [Peniophora sp. CONT]
MSPVPTTAAAALPTETTVVIYDTTPAPPPAIGHLFTVLIIFATCFVLTALAVFWFRAALYPLARSVAGQIGFWRWRSARRQAEKDAEKEERELRMQRMRVKLAAAKSDKAARMRERDEEWHRTRNLEQPPSAARGGAKEKTHRDREVYRPRGAPEKQLPPPPYQD